MHGPLKVAGLGVLLTFSLVPATSAQLATAQSDASAIEVLTYSEAAQRGIDVSVPVGIPLCDLNPDWPGYPTQAEAVRGAERADSRPVCAADPRLVEYVLGGLPPSADHQSDPYHYNGQTTSSPDFEGGRGQLKVKNLTGIDHGQGAPFKFGVERILVKKAANPTACQNPNDTIRWAEAGWSEISESNNDQRRVYSWGTDDCAWRFFDQEYNLQDGQFYSWRLMEVNDNLHTSILWADQWQFLDSHNIDCSPDACTVEVYLEIVSTVDAEHPGWSGHATLRSLDVKYDGAFSVWSSTIATATSDKNPYTRCTVSDFDEFYVVDSGTC